MSRTLKIILFSGFCIFSFLSTAATKADTMYYVSGTAIFTGNSVCGGNPCTETLNFSLDFYYEPFSSAPTLYEAQVTNINTSSSGDLGSFVTSFSGPEGLLQPEPSTGYSGGPCGGPGDQNRIGFAGAGFSEVDMHFCDDFDTAAFVPVIKSIDVFSCGTTCKTDFAGPFDQNPDAFDLMIGPSSLTYTVSTIPEPATILMLASGILGLAFMYAFGSHRKRAQPKAS
jgi:hypothetical protein